jgi:hypothetical protein
LNIFFLKASFVGDYQITNSIATELVGIPIVQNICADGKSKIKFP